jgi:hypothetical protein
MFGKVLLALLVTVPFGFAIGLIQNPFTEAIATFLVLAGSAVLGFLAIVVVVLLVEGFLFRSTDRWHHFN